ncbi:MAG: hypothetical protein HY925_15065 [Elusimicrobia bacterium]|nr:hypothetical protein [Elusimicrobiota bacterium]
MSLTALVRGLFDYAGMYPPASLSFEAALAKSAGFPKTLRRPGMVAGDLVCGVERLASIDAAHLGRAGWDSSRPFSACALGPVLAGPGAPGAEEQKAAAARAVSFGAGEGPKRDAISYEVKCPVSHLADGRTAEALAAVRAGLGGYAGGLYVEPECPSTEWPGAVETVFDVFDGLPDDGRPALKVRCSGPAAIDAESLSRVIAGAVDRGWKLKATAGLHHPIVERRYENRLGFLGLVLAVRLRRALGAGFSAPLIAGCVSANDPGQFDFLDGGAAWLKFRLSASQLAGRAGLTIGSCSLDEPDDDLARLFPKEAEKIGVV